MPSISTADGTRLKNGTILGIFPKEDLVLMKFDFRPKFWVPLATKEPEVGDPVALLPMDPHDPLDGKVAAIEGPVMAKRSVPSANLKEAQFTRVLSLGAGMSAEQREFLSDGCLVIDSKGELVAVFRDVDFGKRQIFIHLAPLTEVAAKVGDLLKNPSSIPFPLPLAMNPRDAVALDMDWRPLIGAIMEKDRDTAAEIYERLRSRHPKSFRLKMVSINPVLNSLEKPSGAFAGEEAFDTAASPAQRAIQLSLQANLHFSKGDREKGLAVIEPVLKLCPKDCANFRAVIAGMYLRADRLEEAEALCREAYPYYSDSIELHETMEKLFTRQGKFDEGLQMTTRVLELERLYRPR